jgi:16S rRNA (adenine1518-N6/adenine1519-N6)-dimethyltransferase
MVNACNLKSSDTVLEIGAGKGALTRALSENVQQVIAVEKDRQLADHLQQEYHGTNIQVVHGDILDYPLDTLPPHTKIIGNLPYNIATPIIKAIIHERLRVNDFYATVQWEYGQRLTAHPGTKASGAFSCFVQYFADIKLLFKLKNTAFWPSPKVQSCFLHFTFPPQPKFKANNEDLLFKIIRAGFEQRRKNICNALSGLFGKEKAAFLLEKSKISPHLRAENISLEEFITLADITEETMREKRRGLDERQT